MCRPVADIVRNDVHRDIYFRLSTCYHLFFSALTHDLFVLTATNPQRQQAAGPVARQAEGGDEGDYSDELFSILNQLPKYH